MTPEYRLGWNDYVEGRECRMEVLNYLRGYQDAQFAFLKTGYIKSYD